MLPLALMDLSTLRGFAIITILGVLVGILVTRPAYGKIIMAILSR
jgi:preprotein translocase subunit SecD